MTRRIRLTADEFHALQGVHAIAALALLQIRGQVAAQIAAAERPPREAIAALAVKYPALRPDRQYQLDDATCSLVEIVP